MTKHHLSDNAIEAYLSKADPALGQLIAQVIAKVGIQRPSHVYESGFQALARSIISQQLSVKAAATIYARFIALAGSPLTPQNVRVLSIDQLRATGLSLPKARYMHHLSDWFAEHHSKIADPDLTDEDLIRLLTGITGIGVWTVQMFLIFYLKRPDVLPLGDLGIQKGVQLLYGLKNKPAPGFITRKAKAWQPYRSIACLYLWKAFDVGIW